MAQQKKTGQAALIIPSFSPSQSTSTKITGSPIKQAEHAKNPRNRSSSETRTPRKTENKLDRQEISYRNEPQSQTKRKLSPEDNRTSRPTENSKNKSPTRTSSVGTIPSGRKVPRKEVKPKDSNNKNNEFFPTPNDRSKGVRVKPVNQELDSLESIPVLNQSRRNSAWTNPSYYNST